MNNSSKLNVENFEKNNNNSQKMLSKSPNFKDSQSSSHNIGTFPKASIEMRNINCGFIKKLEGVFINHDIKFKRENYVENSLLIGEITVIFKLFDNLQHNVKKNCSSIFESIFRDGVNSNQHVKVNGKYINNYASFMSCLNTI